MALSMRWQRQDCAARRLLSMPAQGRLNRFERTLHAHLLCQDVRACHMQVNHLEETDQ
jgi:hypothetical protein